MAFGAYRLISCRALKRTIRNEPQVLPSNCARNFLLTASARPGRDMAGPSIGG